MTIMKRTCLISCALTAAVLAPTAASAEPAILYIPTEPVTLRPTGVAPCSSDVNSALGCGGASMEVEEPPYADAAALIAAMDTNLGAYDVLVTDTRPPEYISYTMLLASTEPLDMDSGGFQSFTCTFGGDNCGALARNRIYSTSGTTNNCIDPTDIHAAMYAFGRSAGLEGVANPEDWMNYELGVGSDAGPDYATPPMGFTDVCNDRVAPQGFNDRDMQIDLPLSCTSLDHVECDGPGGMQGQNSHQDLLLFFGERVEDVDPPELSNIVPEDGAMLNAGDSLVLDVDITDNDPVVGGRWTITSDAIAEQFPDGLTQCTNDVCDQNWNDAVPLKPVESDWAVTLDGLPSGDYVITFEAADYHGNVAETVTINVSIGGGGGEDTTDGTTTVDPTDPTNTTGEFTTGQDDTTSDGTAAADGGDDGGGGCSCTTDEQGPKGAVFMLLGLMGLGAMRRRW